MLIKTPLRLKALLKRRFIEPYASQVLGRAFRPPAAAEPDEVSLLCTMCLEKKEVSCFERIYISN